MQTGKQPPKQSHLDSQAKIAWYPQKWETLPLGKFMPEDGDEFWYICINKEKNNYVISCGDDSDEEIFTIESVEFNKNSLDLHIFINSIKSKNTYSLYLKRSTELRCLIQNDEVWTVVKKLERDESVIIHYDNEDRDSISEIILEYNKGKLESPKVSIINKATGARVRRRMMVSNSGKINFSIEGNGGSLKLKASIRKMSQKFDRFVLNTVIDYRMVKVD